MAKDNITYPSLITLGKISSSVINKDVVDKSVITDDLVFDSPIGIESIITQYSNGIVTNAIFGEIAVFDFDVIANFSGEVVFTVNWGVEVGTTIINATLVNSVTQSLQTSILIPEGVDTDQTINVTDSLGGSYQVGYTIESSGLDNFIFSINTALGDGLNQYQLPLPAGQTYDFYADKNNGDPLIHITTYNQAETLLTWSSGTLQQVTITGKMGGFSTNNGGDKLKVISVDQWGSVDFDDLRAAFRGCTNLESVYPVTIRSTTTDLSFFIGGCPNLASISFVDSDTSNVVNFANFMQGDSSLISIDLEGFDVSSSLSFSSFANGCTSLVTLAVSSWTPSSGTNFLAFVAFCSDLTTFDPSGWGMGSATNIQSFAYNCSSLGTLNTDSWDTSAITTCLQAFFGMSSLTSSFLDTLWWNRVVPVPSFTNCFKGDFNIVNYVSIPNGWKGL